MTRLQKVRTVASFEFLSAVKRPGYLIATFGMPLFLAFYGAVVAIPAYYAEQKDRELTVHGVVDRSGLLALEGDVAAGQGPQVSDEMRRTLKAAGQGKALDQALGPSQFVFRPYATADEAHAALAARHIRGFFVLPEGYLADGAVEAYSAATGFSLGGPDARDALRELVRERLVAGRVDPIVGERIIRPLRTTERFAVTGAGEIREGGGTALLVRTMVPLLFMFLFLLSILMTSGYLMQGTATEKENKVVEVLLASANPDEILGGKLLGLGAAGLLQIAVWLSMMLVAGIGVAPLLLASSVDMPWTALALAIPFFIVAFLFFGSLILGTGSLGSNMREAQQLAMVWSLMAAFPLMMLTVLVRDPHGTMGRILTWIPFTSGPVIVLRASADSAALGWWEIGGAFAVLVLSTYVALRVGGRLFRIGLLSAGARPSLREILTQARLAG